MYLCTFHYTPEDVDCKLCSKFVKGQGCTESVCPWMTERIEAGVVGYAEAVRDIFPKEARLDARVRTVVKGFSGSLYLDAAHRQRMERAKARMGYRRNGETSAYLAAIYLLTSNEDLYHRAANCFCRCGLEVAYATTRGISAHNYALLSAARDIYSETTGLTLTDLSSKELVDELAFSLILNAMLIARYGPAVLGIRERSGK